MIEIKEKKENEFLKIVNNPLTKSSSVTRYSGNIQNNRESLSDHICDVSAMAYLISRKLIVNGINVDSGKILERCLVHDFDEVLIGDIPRLTKYANPIIHEQLDNLAVITAKGLSEKIDGTDYTYQVWRNSKDESIEGMILKVVDILSVSKKVIREVDFTQNLDFCKIAEEVSLYVTDLIEMVKKATYIDDFSREYLVSILEGTIEVMNRIYCDNINKINMYSIVDDITSYILSNRDH